MAKLSDLQDLIARAGDVTPARARVLVQFARKAGHFTTGGRGPSAPDMRGRDAAVALLLALQLSPPSEAVDEMVRLRDLPLSWIDIDPSDGGHFRALEPIGLFRHHPEIDHPPRIEPEMLLGDALAAFFGLQDGKVYRFHEVDRIILEQSGECRNVTIEIASHEWTHDSHLGNDGARRWKLIFDNDDYFPREGVTTFKVISVRHLQAFANAIGGEASDAIPWA